MEQQEQSVSVPASMDDVYNAAMNLLDTLQRAKSDQRTSKDRAIQVAYTDTQRLLAWIKVWCFE